MVVRTVSGAYGGGAAWVTNRACNAHSSTFSARGVDAAVPPEANATALLLQVPAPTLRAWSSTLIIPEKNRVLGPSGQSIVSLKECLQRVAGTGPDPLRVELTDERVRSVLLVS